MKWPSEDPEYDRDKRDVIAPATAAYEGYDYATGSAGGLPYLRQMAGAAALRAAPAAYGLASVMSRGTPQGIALGAMAPGAYRAVSQALPLPENRDSDIRQAGRLDRQHFYNDVLQGDYLSAGADYTRANLHTLGQYLKELTPFIPGVTR